MVPIESPFVGLWSRSPDISINQRLV